VEPTSPRTSTSATDDRRRADRNMSVRSIASIAPFEIHWGPPSGPPPGRPVRSPAGFPASCWRERPLVRFLYSRAGFRRRRPASTPTG
jgi:hypothetical protein